MKKFSLKKIKGVTVMLVCVALVLSGCAQIRDKFVRKPKEEPKGKRYYTVRSYDVTPNMELYTKRYIFWKNWHRELLDKLDGGNHKKIVVAVEQDVSNLWDMYRMLDDEKGDKLKVIIDQMMEMEDTIKKSKITSGNRVRIRRKLELLGKEVKKDFSYRKVRGSIRDEFRREEEPAQT